MLENLSNIIDPKLLIESFGLIGLLFIVFAESGLFFGFFFPGDSLLFTAGFLASQGLFDLSTILIGTFACAILGDSFGYWFGKKVGPKIFNREDSLFFHKKHIIKAQNFYNKYGNKTIFLARFVPIVRTFAPIVAGIGQMKYVNFISYNLIGGFVWSFALTLSGYFLGSIVPGIDKYLLPVIAIIIIISILPIVWEIKKNNNK